MRLYLIISLIINTILITLLYKNHLVTTTIYQINWGRISTVWLSIFLIIKFILDLSYIFTKKKIIRKISYIFMIILVLLWFIFMPDNNMAIRSYKQTLSEVLKLNNLFFQEFYPKRELPNDKFIEKMKKSLPISPYLKYGKPLKYNLVVSEGEFLVNQADRPGNIFLVIDKKNQNFIFTASILDQSTNEIKMLFLGKDIFFIDKKLNLLQIPGTKEFNEVLR